MVYPKTEGVVETVGKVGGAEGAENVGNDESVEACLHRNSIKKKWKGKKQEI